MKNSLIRALLFLGVASHASMLLAQSAGAFSATGNMTMPRSGHTATLLNNGKVLIAGGSGSASAELYDAVTGTFTATGNMTMARYDPTATLLADGKVLIAGGYYFGPLASAELYDPVTGAFTATGNMTTPRSFHTATLLADGKVLIAGAELYDPATGAFTTAARYSGSFDNLEGFGSPATLLPDGRVLFAVEPAAVLYDPVTGAFKLTGAMTTGGALGKPNYIRGRTAALLRNGKVLVAGGEHEDMGSFASAELYDPSNGTFAATGNMTAARVDHTATLLPDGTVLIAGSQLSPGSTASAEIYDPSSGAFAVTGNMTTPRFFHTATLLPDGTVLMAGGIPGWPAAATSSAEVYKPPLLTPAPLLLSLSGDGRGQGAILHAGTARAVSASDPAVAGEALEIYVAGLLDGSVIPPQVTIGGRLAEILSFGKVPGFAVRPPRSRSTSGVNQVNVRVPSGIAPGPAVPVRLMYLGRPSNEVTIGVR